MALDRRYGVIEGLGMKAPCIAATAGSNITLSGLQTLDGVALVAGYRVLVKDQTDQTKNGIYLADSAAWTRDLDFDGALDIVSGTMVFVSQGTTNAKTLWEVSTADPISIDGSSPSNITFAQLMTTITSSVTAAPLKNPPVGADWFSIVDSVTGLLARLTLTNLVAYLQGLTSTFGLSITGNAATATVATNATNVNGYTANVASATTPDIWTGTGNVVQYTGTATATGFAAAPAAGAQRKLLCTGACAFTAGANLIIEGIPSGYTVTMAANASVEILAITITQFKLKYSFSGQFTAQCLTGFTSPINATATYSSSNGYVALNLPVGVITGTSNTTGFTITNLPACIQPSFSLRYFPLVLAEDNGVRVIGTADIIGGTIALLNGVAGGAWTNSGTKALFTTEFFYTLFP